MFFFIVLAPCHLPTPLASLFFCSLSFILQTAPFSGANTGVYWLRAHALGAERDIEVTISNKNLEQKGAKITFHIYND